VKKQATELERVTTMHRNNKGICLGCIKFAETRIMRAGFITSIYTAFEKASPHTL
jgi:hypothetical protein